MRKITLLLGALIFVLGACSDDDDPPPKDDTGTQLEAGTDTGPGKEAGTDAKVPDPDKSVGKEAGTDSKVATPDKAVGKEAGTDGTIVPPDGFKPATYAIVITEIMSNPVKVTDAKGEYFEIYNAGTATVDLTGWTIKDKDSDKHVIAAANGTTSIGVGKFLVLGNNKDTKTNGGVTVDYNYGTKFYISGADELILWDKNGKEVDKVYWTSTWKLAAGASHSLKGPSLDNNVSTNWCVETKAWTGSAGDKGTPGAKAGCGP